MSYRLSSKKRQQRKNFWLKSVVALFVSLVFLGFFLLLGGTIASLSSGVVETADGAKSALRGVASNKQDLIEENQVLKNELARQSVDRQIQSSLIQRNNELLTELGRGGEVRKVLAGVVKKPPFSPYDIYTVDAGTENGVAVGNLALFSDYVTLGQVSRVNTTGAKITLFSAPGKETEMIIGGQVFTVRGQGGGSLEVRVPRDFDVEIGDVVTLPSYRLYAVGSIAGIDFRPQDSIKKLTIKVPVNIEAVQVLSLVPYITDTFDEITEIPSTQ